MEFKHKDTLYHIIKLVNYIFNESKKSNLYEVIISFDIKDIILNIKQINPRYDSYLNEIIEIIKHTRIFNDLVNIGVNEKDALEYIYYTRKYTSATIIITIKNASYSVYSTREFEIQLIEKENALKILEDAKRYYIKETKRINGFIR